MEVKKKRLKDQLKLHQHIINIKMQMVQYDQLVGHRVTQVQQVLQQDVLQKEILFTLRQLEVAEERLYGLARGLYQMVKQLHLKDVQHVVQVMATKMVQHLQQDHQQEHVIEQLIKQLILERDTILQDVGKQIQQQRRMKLFFNNR